MLPLRPPREVQYHREPDVADSALQEVLVCDDLLVLGDDGAFCVFYEQIKRKTDMILFILDPQLEIIDFKVDRRFVVFMKTVAFLFDVQAVSADFLNEKPLEEDYFFGILCVGGKRGR